jgi:hypothetical protein
MCLKSEGQMIKKLMVGAAILLMLVATAQAEDTDRASCEDFENLAKKIMTGRLAGVAMSDMMRVSKKDKLMDMLIMEAYESPMYTTESYKTRAISEFSNKTYMRCTKARSNEK